MPGEHDGETSFAPVPTVIRSLSARIDEAIAFLREENFLEGLTEAADASFLPDLRQRVSGRLRPDKEFAAALRNLQSVAPKQRHLKRTMSRSMYKGRAESCFYYLGIVLALVTSLVLVGQEVMDGSVSGRWVAVKAAGFPLSLVLFVTYWQRRETLQRTERVATEQLRIGWLKHEEEFRELDGYLDELTRTFVHATVVAMTEERGLGKRDEFAKTVAEYAGTHPYQKMGERYDMYSETADLSHLAKLITTLETGSIGISGERGVGKTAVMRALERTVGGGERSSVVSVWISAPTAVNEKEFLLSTLAKVATCVGAAVSGNESWPDLPPEEKLKAEDGLRRWRAVSLLCVGATAVVALGGYVVKDLPLVEGVVAAGWHRLLWLGVAVPLLGLLWRATKTFGGRQFAGIPQVQRPLVGASQDLLEELWYERKEVQSSSVTLSQFGLALLYGAGSERTREPFTLPHLVQMWDEYIGHVTNKKFGGFDKVVVFIDEIDKLKDAAKIGRFMRILKALYNPVRLFFVVSISDDAYDRFRSWQSLETRRDELDSSFDHMHRIDRMNAREVQRLLDDRVLGHKLPVPVVRLIWALSRGNPRDTLRLGRQVLDEYQGQECLWVALKLWSEQIRETLDGWCQSLHGLGQSGVGIVERLRDLVDGERAELEKKTGDTVRQIGDVIGEVEQAALSATSGRGGWLEMQAELGYAATLYELFCTPQEDTGLRRLLEHDELLQMIGDVQTYLSGGSGRRALECLGQFRSSAGNSCGTQLKLQAALFS